MPLTLSRNTNQAVVLETKNGPIEVIVRSKSRVRLSIDAPADVKIMRGELIPKENAA